jgi:ATP-dependent Lhr-like helicase
MLADDLMAAVFPDAAACLENIPGDRQIPDHPLVSQTVRDCLQEAMDFDGLTAVLDRIHRGELALVARDTPEPSVFAHEILNARPYSFLDDAPLEERRAHAVQTRRSGDPSSAGDLGALDHTAIARVRAEAAPDPRDADELHDALLVTGFLTDGEIEAGAELMARLVSARRACRVALVSSAPGTVPEIAPGGFGLVVAAERIPEVLAIHPAASLTPPIDAPPSRSARVWTRDEAIVELLRGRLAIAGPTTAAALAGLLGITERAADSALLTLEAEGVVLRGRFTAHQAGVQAGPADSQPATATSGGGRMPISGSEASVNSEASIEWCDRALLARIHRYTLNRLRAEIEPVSPAGFMRFLFAWQHVDPATRLTGIDGLREIVAMLDGFELAAGAWERAVLPARVTPYEPQMLDMLCLAGEVGWARLSFPTDLARLAPATPVALFLREHGDAWQRLRATADRDPMAVEAALSDRARAALGALRSRGASFFNDLASHCALDADTLRQAIGELVASGLAACDGFSGVRALVQAALGRPAPAGRANFTGRWSALRMDAGAMSRTADVETLAWTLLRRYGIVFRRVLAREATAAHWRELTRVYRRLEARGEIRGGRFVTGMSGEQFALPDAVARLREIRRAGTDGRLITISAADPLNLTGIVTAGDRIRTARRNQIVYRDGIPLAVMEGDFVRELSPIEPAIAADVSRAFGRRSMPAVLR